MNILNLAQRVKELRNRKGISQENLAEESGLSLRTIQRVENNETVPRGDTLKKIAIALDTSPDEIIDWKIQEDQNYLILMSISALGFLFFPLLGIIIALVMWISKKDKIKNVNALGKGILNFQISWILFLFGVYCIIAIVFLICITTGILGSWTLAIFQSWFPITIIFYSFNLLVILLNTSRIIRNKPFTYKPALIILR